MNNITKVVYLLASPLSKYDAKRFGVELIRKNGFEVEVWDFTSFMDPDYAKRPDHNKINSEKSRIFSTKKEAISAISNLSKNCIIICFVSYGYKSYSIFKAMSKRNIPYCTLFYTFPTFHMRSRKNIFEKLLMDIPFSALFNYLFINIPIEFLALNPASIILISGEKNIIPKALKGKKTKIIPIHYFDYDYYLDEIQKPVANDEAMGVFLDAYIPFHPDWSACWNLLPRISAEEYYPPLCKFFDFLEKKHGMHIVIAAHPRSTYEKLQDYFGGRLIIRDRTPELVRRCKFVILHHSAAVSLAVLFKKPLIFVTSDKLQQTIAGEITGFIASMFSKTPVNLNNDFKMDLNREFIVDDKLYKDYRNSYIKQEGTENIPIWQIFANHLRDAET